MGVVRQIKDLGNGYQEVTADLTYEGQVTVTIPTVMPPGHSILDMVRYAVKYWEGDMSIPRVGGKERGKGNA